MTEFLQLHNSDDILKEGNYLWKYLDLHKYLSFLLKPSFYLSRIDQFDDLLEGMSHNEMARHHISNVTIRPEDVEANDGIKLLQNIQNDLKGKEQMKQELRYANCLFLGKEESMAMWQIYSSPGSVVLRIEPKSLIECLDSELINFKDKSSIKVAHFGKVRYTEGKVPIRALRKNKSYSHEKEVRLILELKQFSEEKGYSIPLDYRKLRYDIICHPTTNNWQHNNLINLTGQYLKKNLEHSKHKNTLRNNF